jgi:hypothetical protein
VRREGEGACARRVTASACAVRARGSTRPLSPLGWTDRGPWGGSVLASLVCAPVRAGGGGGGFGASDSIIFVLLRRGFGRAPPR